MFRIRQVFLRVELHFQHSARVLHARISACRDTIEVTLKKIISGADWPKNRFILRECNTLRERERDMALCVSSIIRFATFDVGFVM